MIQKSSGIATNNFVWLEKRNCDYFSKIRGIVSNLLVVLLKSTRIRRHMSGWPVWSICIAAVSLSGSPYFAISLSSWWRWTTWSASWLLISLVPFSSNCRRSSGQGTWSPSLSLYAHLLRSSTSLSPSKFYRITALVETSAGWSADLLLCTSSGSHAWLYRIFWSVL